MKKFLKFIFTTKKGWSAILIITSLAFFQLYFGVPIVELMTVIAGHTAVSLHGLAHMIFMTHYFISFIVITTAVAYLYKRSRS